MRLIKQPIDSRRNYYTRKVSGITRNTSRSDQHVPQRRTSRPPRIGSLPEALTVCCCGSPTVTASAVYTPRMARVYDSPHTTMDASKIRFAWNTTGNLRAAHEAMKKGVDLRGYYAWSLLDNTSGRTATRSASHRARRHRAAANDQVVGEYSPVIQAKGDPREIAPQSSGYRSSRSRSCALSPRRSQPRERVDPRGQICCSSGDHTTSRRASEFRRADSPSPHCRWRACRS